MGRAEHAGCGLRGRSGEGSMMAMGRRRGSLAGAVASVALAWLVGIGCAAPQSAAPRAAPAEPQAAPVASGASAVAAAAPARPPAEPVRLKFHFPSRSTSYLPWY